VGRDELSGHGSKPAARSSLSVKLARTSPSRTCRRERIDASRLVPVIPPELRPTGAPEGGPLSHEVRTSMSLTARVINATTGLKRLIELRAPGIIVYAYEKRHAAEAVTTLSTKAGAGGHHRRQQRSV